MTAIHAMALCLGVFITLGFFAFAGFSLAGLKSERAEMVAGKILNAEFGAFVGLAALFLLSF